MRKLGLLFPSLEKQRIRRIILCRSDNRWLRVGYDNGLGFGASIWLHLWRWQCWSIGCR